MSNEVWQDFGCNHTNYNSAQDQPLVSAMIMGAGRTITYKVVFTSDLKDKGKPVPRSTVINYIDEVVKIGISDKVEANFKRVSSGHANYVFVIERHPDPYAGTYFSSQHIMMNARDPRGWSKGKIQIIALHELCHSYSLLGPHNSGSFVENSIRYSHLMHPDDGKTPKYKRYPTWTSPQEATALQRKLGKPVAPPTPPKPDPDPTPNPDPKPPTPPPEPSNVTKIEAEDYVTSIGVYKRDTSDIGGGQQVSYIDKGETMTYQINLPEDGIYDVSTRLSCSHSDAQFSLKVGNVNSGFIVVPNTGFGKWETITIRMHLKKGVQSLNFKSESGRWYDVNWFEFALIEKDKPKTEDELMLEKLKEERKPLVSQRNTLKADLAKDRAEMAELAAERNNYRVKLDAANAKLRTLNQDITATADALFDTNQEIIEINEKIAALEAKLK